MEISKILLNEFKNQETKYYDEGVLESKIISLETTLFKNLGENKEIYNEIKSYYQTLLKMKAQRLIDFVINKFHK